MDENCGLGYLALLKTDKKLEMSLLKSSFYQTSKSVCGCLAWRREVRQWTKHSRKSKYRGYSQYPSKLQLWNQWTANSPYTLSTTTNPSIFLSLNSYLILVLWSLKAEANSSENIRNFYKSLAHISIILLMHSIQVFNLLIVEDY